VPSEFIGLGALVGSILAAWFRRSVRWLLQIVGGTWIEFTSAHWLRDWLAWPVSVDYDLLSGTIMGVMGYSLLQLALSPQILAYLKTRIVKAAEP